MSTRWSIRPFDPQAVQQLAREAGLSPLCAQLLINRGVTDAPGARAFLDLKLSALHDPETLPGAAEAAARIVAAIRAGKKIVVYGDYDADGVSGTSLLWACLRLAGAKNVDYYIPHRIEEGYGLNSDAIATLARDHGADLIVTVDCGISAVEQAKLARQLGIELIITDHHTIGPELPEADVLVHPRLPGSRYPFGELCGAGVAFKVAWQVCKSFGDGKKASPHMRDFLVESMGFVALATVADVVPLTGENRLLVKHGLKGLAASPSIGLRALLESAAIDLNRGVNSGQIGFKIAPRINAAGRLEGARKAVELLTTTDPDRAYALAEELERHNQDRQAVERRIVDHAHALIHESGGASELGAIVLRHKDWHPGVVGIVASRLVDAYHRPTIVCAETDATCQGSARSVPGFDLYLAIAACSEGLTSFGGHAAAAGLKVPPDMFDEFAQRFDAHCRSNLAADQRQKTLHIDAEPPLDWLTLSAVSDVEKLEPFGQGNPKPLVAISNVRLVEDPKFVGQDGKTVQLRFGSGETVVRAVAWTGIERWRKLTKGTIVSIVGEPGINEFRGKREVQLVVRDFKSAEDAHAAAPAVLTSAATA